MAAIYEILFHFPFHFHLTDTATINAQPTKQTEDGKPVV